MTQRTGNFPVLFQPDEDGKYANREALWAPVQIVTIPLTQLRALSLMRHGLHCCCSSRWRTSKLERVEIGKRETAQLERMESR